MPADDLHPLRTVLVVEDESLVLFNLEDILAELGISVMGPAMRLKQALALAAGECQHYSSAPARPEILGWSHAGVP